MQLTRGSKTSKNFCSLWKHAFLFHRCWNAVDQEFIYDYVLQKYQRVRSCAFEGLLGRSSPRSRRGIRSKVCTNFSFQAVVKSKPYQVLLSTSSSEYVLIDRQHCRTTLSHPEEEADVGHTDTQEELCVLEPGPDSLQDRLVAIKEKVHVTGDEDAKVTAEVLKKIFHEGAMQIQIAPGTATTIPLGILGPQVSNTPYSNELGDIYGKANIFGRIELSWKLRFCDFKNLHMP